MDLSLSKLRQIVKDREAWYAAGHGIEKSHKESEVLNKNHSSFH